MSKLGDYQAGLGIKTNPIPDIPRARLAAVVPPTPKPVTPPPTTSSIIPKIDPANPNQEESVWSKIVRNLNKPVGVVATASEQLGKQIGSVAAGDFSFSDIKDTPAKIGGILSGKESRLFSDVFRDNWQWGKKDSQSFTYNFVNSFVPAMAGLITDLTADPLNVLGGGITKTGALIDKVNDLKRVGDTIAKDSKLAKEISKLGLTADDFIKPATKAEQAAKGQRALLYLTTGVDSQKVLVKGEPIYKLMDKAGDYFVRTKAAQVLNKVFSTKTSNEAFNVVKQHFTDLKEYRQGKVMKEAVALRDKLAGFSPEEVRMVNQVIETGKKTGTKAIDDIARQLEINYANIRDQEKALGILDSDLELYSPHFKKVAEDDGLLKKAKDWFSNSRVWDDTLKTSQKREIARFIDEAGNDVIGKADNLKLEELKTPKLIDGVEYNYKNKAGQYFKAIRGDDEVAGLGQATIKDINEAFGTEFFDERAAVNYAKRAMGSAKAVTSKEFFNSTKQFADEAADSIAVKPKELAGLKFPPEIANQIDAYYNRVAPEELNIFLKTFDKIQNWWKAQALVAPSYHTRNFVGNTWNNFLADVRNPVDYADALKLQTGKKLSFVDDAGRTWSNEKIIDAAEQAGVLGRGWYAADIEQEIGSGLNKMSLSPLKQDFALFRANRKVGEVFENNARLAHFVSKLRQGNSVDMAAQSVKKYLFDYNDLTPIERNVFKRVAPFYTWTRKNIPLQLESLITKPSKAAVVTKTQHAIEDGVEKPNEKYLSDYIKNNVGVRVRKDEKGNTFYFLMGNWMPSAQAIDFLSQPLENLVISVSPLLKVPAEEWANKSFFFEDTFGKGSPIERYEGEQESWMGVTMRKKTAYILKNIRFLNELDKWNPGSVWGSKSEPSALYNVSRKGSANPKDLLGALPSTAVKMGVDAASKIFPDIGATTPAQKEVGKSTPPVSQNQRTLQLVFGKLTPYNPSFARKFYQWDTDTKVREMERGIKNALRDGQTEYAKELRKELLKVRKERR